MMDFMTKPIPFFLLAVLLIPMRAALRVPAGSLEKQDITVVVTDSGLGGLSVLADTAARLKNAGLYRRVHLIFFNALFSNDSGYNSLSSRAEKIRIFNNVLKSIDARFNPDRVLVACNTLSVLLPDTPFARTAKIPVVGIVEPGAVLLAEAWKKAPAAAVVLFGTETTIAEDAHRARLIALGVPTEKIIVQACPELASYIENGPAADETALLVSANLDEALARLPSPSPPILAGLICTHYGYSLDLWAAALAEKKITVQGILNPNARLADAVIPVGAPKRHEQTEIDVRVLSMVEIAPRKRDALAPWLAKRSPETAAAFRAYEWIPGLFNATAPGQK
jgi:glutamate racemase